jgi:hypothetical protein
MVRPGPKDQRKPSAHWVQRTCRRDRHQRTIRSAAKQLSPIGPASRGSHVRGARWQFARTDFAKTGFAAAGPEHERSECEGGLTLLRACHSATAPRRLRCRFQPGLWDAKCSLVPEGRRWMHWSQERHPATQRHPQTEPERTFARPRALPIRDQLPIAYSSSA